MVASEMASKVGKAFAMMSNTYTFDFMHDGVAHCRLTNARVVGVSVHESEPPEILIFDPSVGTSDFYPIDELQIVEVLQVAA